MPRTPPLAVLAVIALVLAGCGSSTPSEPSASPSGPGTTRPPATSATAPGTTSSVDGTAPAAPTPGDHVTIVSYEFRPGTLQATAGSTVTWTNDEANPPVDHWVRSIPSAEKVVDSGRMAPGTSYQQAVPGPGSYAYYCVIHNFMTGTLVVI